MAYFLSREMLASRHFINFTRTKTNFNFISYVTSKNIHIPTYSPLKIGVIEKTSLFGRCLYTSQWLKSSSRYYSSSASSTNSVKSIIDKADLKASGEDGNSSKNNDNEEDEQIKRTKQWKQIKLSMFVTGFCVSGMIISSFMTFGAPETDESGQDIIDEFSHLPTAEQWCKRYINRLLYWKKVIEKPSSKKLLPDFPPNIIQPYTLVIELKDVLIHPDWTLQTGWRMKKRPHLDAFLADMRDSMFEIVVFTSDSQMTIAPVIEQLNKIGAINAALFRDATDFIDGHHVKNLDHLNRDLSKVIIVDWDNRSVKLHRDNALVLPRWNGDDNDTSLVDLANILKVIAMSGVEDVRTVLSYYKDYPDPLAQFRQNQLLVAQQYEEQERLQKEQYKESVAKKFAKARFL